MKCYCFETGEHIALKVIKNQPAYFHQARMEIAILQYLNSQYDLENKHHIVRMLDFCKFKNHLCIAFELLHDNLYELLKLNHFHGLSLNLVRALVSQVKFSFGRTSHPPLHDLTKVTRLTTHFYFSYIYFSLDTHCPDCIA